MNQAVIVTNHDKFPVMLNERKAAQYLEGASKKCFFGGLVCVGSNEPNTDGMIDDVHCLMTPQTHLNFLADWIDLHDAIYSPGDMLLELGDFLFSYAPLVWAFCMVQLALTGKLSTP